LVLPPHSWNNVLCFTSMQRQKREEEEAEEEKREREIRKSSTVD
jgi:hypothetical protein